ncbi:MAG: hypothetical protein Q7S87_05310 [Agitococcus sp.]|nr:hypothetical protein [Agitococcus sp.]
MDILMDNIALTVVVGGGLVVSVFIFLKIKNNKSGNNSNNTNSGNNSNNTNSNNTTNSNNGNINGSNNTQNTSNMSAGRDVKQANVGGINNKSSIK